MSLSFPNASRSYDPDGHRIRFWGYDNALEVAFFVEEDAIFRLDPKAKDTETSLLATFDAYLERIRTVAGRMYSGSRRRFYTLVAADF
jgi:hypothetical protein